MVSLALFQAQSPSGLRIYLCPHQETGDNYAADPCRVCLFDWVHEVDLLFYLFGEMTARTAFAQQDGPLKLGADEQISVTLTSREGSILSNLLLSYLVNPPIRKTTIMGDVGLLEVDITRREVFSQARTRCLNGSVLVGSITMITRVNWRILLHVLIIEISLNVRLERASRC